MPLLRYGLLLLTALLSGTSILEAAPAAEAPFAASLLTPAKVKCKTIKGNRVCMDVGDKKNDGEKKKSKASKENKTDEPQTTESSPPPAQKPDPQEWQNKAQEAEGRFSVGTDAVEAGKK